MFALFQWKLLKLSVFADYPFSNLLIYIAVNSLTTERQTTKLSSANFQTMLSQSFIVLGIQRLEGKQCRSSRGGSL